MAEWGPVILLEMCEGLPLRAEQREDRTHVAAGGDTVIEHIESIISRDSAGRIRLEWLEQREGEDPVELVYLIDARSYSYILAAKENVAARVCGPGSQIIFPTIGRLFPGGKWQSTVEQLGTRTFQELVLAGTRTTWTMEDDPTESGTEERWRSESLRLCYAASSHGPTWKHEAQLSIISRSEPDPRLWSLPPLCKVEELEGDVPSGSRQG